MLEIPLYRDRSLTPRLCVYVLSVALVCCSSPPKNVLPVETSATFKVDEHDLHKPLTLIVYGDMRFTDSANHEAANSTARQALVARIAMEKPDAVLVNGDVPWNGGDEADYAVYQNETAVWQTNRLRVYPALGNHEFSGCKVQQCLENWWTAFEVDPSLVDCSGSRCSAL